MKKKVTDLNDRGPDIMTRRLKPENIPKMGKLETIDCFGKKFATLEICRDCRVAQSCKSGMTHKPDGQLNLHGNAYLRRLQKKSMFEHVLSIIKENEPITSAKLSAILQYNYGMGQSGISEAINVLRELDKVEVAVDVTMGFMIRIKKEETVDG